MIPLAQPNPTTQLNPFGQPCSLTMWTILSLTLVSALQNHLQPNNRKPLSGYMVMRNRKSSDCSIYVTNSQQFSLVQSKHRVSPDTILLSTHEMSRAVRKPDSSLCENKGADQLCSNCTADQRLYFRYRDSTIPLLLKSKFSCF